jgi:hypothetical protein
VARPKRFSNPFYAVLLVVGVIFSITACAYCVMAFRAVTSTQAAQVSPSGEGLMQFLDRCGLWLMVGEIIVLAIATVGAIGTDDYWMKRNKISSEARASNRESPP